MRRRITWFIFGFIVSWLTWLAVGYIRLRPRDYTQPWSQTQKEIAPAWLKHATGRRLGSIMVFTPPDSSPACALIQPQKPNHFPQIVIQDEDADGIFDSLFIGDKRYKSFLIEDKDADGIFDSSQYSTGVATNSVSIWDNNMDGIPDIRLGPGRRIAVTIDGEWLDLVHTNKKQFVEINGHLTRVKAVGGMWQVIEE